MVFLGTSKRFSTILATPLAPVFQETEARKELSYNTPTGTAHEATP
jgi:hypothetical protein